ncbi:MAG: hypothetical protein ABSG61_11825 [Gemmatimonadales bacterium]|jgi:hypothetical protein
MTRASVKAWLHFREPEPPADLAAKLAQCVDSAPEAVLAGASLPEVIGALGTWLLDSVVEGQGTGHDTALDLLAADAFVTYAFEAASEEGTDVAGLANQLLAKVSA